MTTEAKRDDLKDFTRDGLALLFAADGKEKYRAEQVFRWIHQRDVTDFSLTPERGPGRFNAQAATTCGGSCGPVSP